MKTKRHQIIENKELFYEESGKTDPIKQGISYTICIGLALILGYLYSVTIIIIPIVYLNFLITIGFGVGLGLVCKTLVRFSHNRSRKSQITQAVATGLLASYFQWTAHILYAYNGGIPGIGFYFANIQWIMVPKNFFEAVSEINRIGTWAIFGITFNGFALTIIWLIEFLLILSGPIIAIVNTRIYPYSELHHKWYQKYTLFKDFEYLSTTNSLINGLANEPISTIENLGKGSGFRHTKVHVFYLKDEQKQFLTFEGVLIEGRGKGKRNSTIILNNFMISKSNAESILDKFENRRERIEVI